ncbi:MAG: enoyl-CoA hydratase [Alphaproteobacteria bacterium]|nr:enoyl-CoA hydratase [Alphaproteobacteria bacterium]
MTDQVTITQADGVLEILWNRPDKKNALSQAMYAKAADALLAASEDKSVRVVLLGSTGDAFTSGNDLSDFAAANASGSSEPRQSSRFIDTIIAFDKPIVAAVPGLAVGVGTTMLLHCDLVYVAKDAKLTVPFVNLALSPEAASSITLPARIGYVRAFAMFALGEALTGEQAANTGFANAALPATEVLPAARAAAKALAQRPVGAVMATKKLMRNAEALTERANTEVKIFSERLRSAEAAEAFTAFREKRPPDFSKV